MKHKDDKGLCKLAMKNSSWTWSQLRHARKLKFKIGEESITDFVMLNFKRWEEKWGAGKFAVKTFNRHEEGLNGSDWEWWFTGPSKQWLGMRIQAKVLDLASEKFNHLDYKKGHQTNLLKNGAKIDGLIPLYCMYSNWDIKKYKLFWSCECCKPTVYHYGTSILDLLTVECFQRKKEKRLCAILNHLRPMHCIFCCQKFGGSDLPHRALRYLEKKKFLKCFDNSDDSKTESYSENLLKEKPPYYVRQLVEDNLDAIEINNNELKRVTVFRELPKE